MGKRKRYDTEEFGLFAVGESLKGSKRQYCEVCSKSIPVEAIESHINGSKHRNMERKLEIRREKEKVEVEAVRKQEMEISIQIVNASFPIDYSGKSVGLSDLNKVLLYLLAGRPALSSLQFQYVHRLQHVVLLIIPGFRQEDYEEAHKECAFLLKPVHIKGEGIRPIGRYLTHALPLKASGNHTYVEYSYDSLFTTVDPNSTSSTKPKDVKVLFEAFTRKYNDWKSKGLPLYTMCKPYVLTPSERVDNQYPMEGGLSGWVDTQSWYHSDAHDMLGLDCEMCKSAKGPELTRVTIVNTDGEVVLDELVKPSNPITDYITQYSGITEEMLVGVETTLADIQARLQDIMDQHTILVGHSLENDLYALQMVHERVMDTAILFPGKRFKSKQKLKNIVSSLLHREIQNGGEGHDSKEDAVAALELAMGKILYGDDFISSKPRIPVGALLEGKDVHVRVVPVGEDPIGKRYFTPSQCREVEDREEQVKVAGEEIEKAMDLEQKTLTVIPMQDPFVSGEEDTLVGLDLMVRGYYERMKGNSLVMVVSPYGDVGQFKREMEKFNKKEEGAQSKEALTVLADEVRRGTLWLGIKPLETELQTRLDHSQ